MRLEALPFNINVQSRLKLHSEVVLSDDDPLKQALYQDLVEGFQVCGLLLDEILKLVDAGNLCIPGNSVNRTFFSLFSEFEDFVGNLIVGFLVVSFFEKLFLELLQSFVNAISGILLSASDHLCNVLLELRLVANTFCRHSSPANQTMTRASMAEKSAARNCVPSRGMNAVRISCDRVSGTSSYKRETASKSPERTLGARLSLFYQGCRFLHHWQRATASSAAQSSGFPAS